MGERDVTVRRTRRQELADDGGRMIGVGQDVQHASWDREAIVSFGRILDWSDSVFEEFSGWFNGKTSPVHLFWHSLVDSGVREMP